MGFGFPIKRRRLSILTTFALMITVAIVIKLLNSRRFSRQSENAQMVEGNRLGIARLVRQDPSSRRRINPVSNIVNDTDTGENNNIHQNHHPITLTIVRGKKEQDFKKEMEEEEAVKNIPSSEKVAQGRISEVAGNGLIPQDISPNDKAPKTQSTSLRDTHQSGEHVESKEDTVVETTGCFKQVQMWTNTFRWAKKEYTQCPGLPCGIRVVENTSFETMQNSDAVILFHETTWNWDVMLQHKPKGQKWVFCSHESPINTKPHVIPPKDRVNATYDYLMSYRRHKGNLFGDFGKFVTAGKSAMPVNDSRNWAQEKTKLVAWAARNCKSSYLHWNRTHFVRSLAKLVDVDMYGRCGNKDCPRNEASCGKILRQHKFYLALENCNCRNYITEKLWLRSYQKEMVPIVYGPPKEDYELVAPPNSFIFVKDYDSLSDLADYLKFLDANDIMYNKYFEWRKIGYVRSYEEKDLFVPENLCEVLIKRMLEDERAVADGTYQPIDMPDWDTWWSGSCHDDGEFPIKMS